MPQTFQRLSLGAVHPAGWLHEQLLQDLEHGFASRLDVLTSHAAHDLFSQRIEASSEQYAWWDAETRGNWLWGYTMMAFLSGHPEHKSRVEQLLQDVVATQDADGYIGIYAPHARYQHGNGENGELWAQSRALLALLTAYEFTHNETFLQSVETAARLTMQHYGPGRSYFRAAANPLTMLVGVTHGLCYVDVMEWLYRLTGNTAYRDFGVWLYDDYSSLPIPFPNDDLSVRSLRDPYRPLSAHAVHTAEHLRVLAWVYYVTGREDLRLAFEAAQRKLAHYTVPNGALIGDESIHGMPSPDIGYEYCTVTEQLFSLSSILQWFATNTNGDQVESLLFNAGQGARLADGSGVSYLTTDTRLDARADRPDSYSHFHGTHGRFKFSPTHEDVACCCNPNATRLLSHYISHQWLRTSDHSGLAAVLYGAGTVRTKINGVDVEIEEVTDYPFDEKVVFLVRTQKPHRFSLHLRVPGWARELQATLNGVRLDVQKDKQGFVIVNREWQMNDQLEVSFDANIVLRPYPAGEYAVFRGALQYALPIEGLVNSIKQYTSTVLRDVEVIPVKLADAYQIPILYSTLSNFGLKFARDEIRGANWHTPGLRLQLGDVSLVPMGSSPLRRAAFPIRRGNS